MKKVTWQRIGAAALAVLVWQAASMAVGSALLRRCCRWAKGGRT